MIQLWGIIILITISVCIIALDIGISYHDFKSRAKQTRADYISRQKQMIKHEVDRVVNMINHEKTQSEVLTKSTIKSRVYEAYSIAQNIYQQNKTAKTRHEIQKMILDALRPIRFEHGSGYYFATRLDGIEILFSDKPEIEGLNLLDLQDTRGQYVIKDMIQIARQSGEGFYEYRWTKPDAAGNDFKKISFIKRFEPFDWFIGTGLYVDDIENGIKSGILSAISRIRFGKEGYIFVNRLNGDALVSNGKIFSGTKKLWEVFNKNPEKTKNIFKKACRAALTPDGDYINYSWMKLTDSDKESPKVSYIYGIPDLQWLVGAGVYLDDVEADIAVMHTKLNNQIKERLLYSTLIIVAVLAIFLFLFNLIIRWFEKDVNLFISFFNRAAFSDEQINRDLVQFNELDRIAKNANKMLQDRIHDRQALLDEREQLFVTIRSIGDGVITTDTSGRVELMNQAAEQLTGWRLEDAEGKHLPGVFHVVNSQTGDKVENPVDKVLESGKIIGLANHSMLISRNGTKYQIADSAAPIKDYTGKIKGVVLVFRDVTKEYRMREDLRQSEKNLRTVFEAAKNVAFVKTDCNDEDAKIIEFSPGAEQIFGYAKKEVIGRPVSILHLQEDVKKFPEILKAMNENKTGFSGESILVKKSGETFPALFTTHPVFSDDGKMTAAIEVSVDISMRKQAEKELKETRNLLETTLNAIPDVIGIQDKKHNIIRYNAAGYDFLNMSYEQVVGKKCYELLGRDRPCEICATTLSYRSRKPEKIEKFEKELNVWLDCRTYPVLNEHGEIVNIVEHLRDITKQKHIENELQKIEKLKSVGTLAGGIAHDFNNIMMGLFGNISLARGKLPKDHPAVKSLEEAEKSMNRAIRLTKQLLTFAKGGNPVKEDVGIGALVEEVVSFDLSGSNVKPVFNTAKDLWIAEVDKGQMQQVFSNLTINAGQAMPDGGHLLITLENADVSAELPPGLKQGKYIKVTVQDEGTGIDPKHLNRIFDPYFSTKQAGSGLGLATVFSIIKKHGGHITADSKLGNGATFTLYLPASESRQFHEAEPPAAAIPAIEQKPRILIMDDEEVVLSVTTEMLEKFGFAAETASDGKQAIEMYKQSMEAGEPFSLVIMDLTIPGGIGGKEAIKNLMAIDPDAGVIVSSGYATDPVMADYGDYGFKGRLMKPFNMKELIKEVTRVIEIT